MKKMDDNEQGKSSRRNFLKKVGVGVGAVSVAGVAGTSLLKSNEAKPNRERMIKLLSPDGNLVEVDQDDIKPAKEIVAELKGSGKSRTSKQEIRNGN